MLPKANVSSLCEALGPLLSHGILSPLGYGRRTGAAATWMRVAFRLVGCAPGAYTSAFEILRQRAMP
jgi:hypothetical protein